MTDKFIFTHSAMNTFDICPRMFDAEYWSKDYKKVWGPKTKEQLDGTAKHKAFETAILHDAPLPPKYSKEIFLGKVLNTINEVSQLLKGPVKSELELAIDDHLNACEYYDKTRAHLRGKLDITCRSKDGKTFYLADLKNGKSAFCGPEQLERNALKIFGNYLGVKHIIADYWFLTEKHKKRYHFVYGNKERDKLMAKGSECKTLTDLSDQFRYDITLIKNCMETGVWTPKPGFLCAKHCSVLDCEHNGKTKKSKTKIK